MLADVPALLRIDLAGDGSRSARAGAFDAMRRDREVYGYITDVTEIDEAGWYGDPGWANEALASDFAATVATEIATQAKSIFELRT